MDDLQRSADRSPAPPGDPVEVGEPLDLREYLHIARRRWGVIALAVALGAAAGWGIIATDVPAYTADVLLRRTARESPLGALEAVANPSKPDEIASELEIIRSRAVLRPVIDALGLRLAIDARVRGVLFDTIEVDPRAAPGWYRLHPREDGVALVEDAAGRPVARAGPGDWLEADGFRIRLRSDAALDEEIWFEVEHHEAAYDRLRYDLGAVQVAETHLIRLRYTAADARLAAAVVNEVARSYQRYSVAQAREESVRRRRFIAEQLAQVADSLARQQAELQRYQEASGLIDPAIEGEALATALMEAESELRTLRFQEGILESVVGSLRSGGDDDHAFQRLIALGGDVFPAGQALYARLRELEADREKLTASRFGYTEDGPRVEVIDSLIAATRSEMRSVAVQALGLVRDRTDAAEARITALRRDVEALPERAGAFTRLRQEVDAVQEVFNLLAARYYEAQIAEAIEAGDVEIVDPAPVPVEPNPTHPARALAFALLLGLFLGVGCALVIERLDTSVRSPDEAADASGLDVLALIPRLDRSANGARRPVPVIATDRERRGERGGEAFRTLRTMLRFVRADRPRVIAVTSPGPDSGKTTVSVNLAAALAQQGRRVLLVDADLRRPVQHILLGRPRAPGLSDLLVGDVELDAAAHAVGTEPGGAENLWLLTCGSAVPNPAELLGSHAFEQLLADTRAGFDTVVVDTPPALAVTDAAVIGPLVDGVLLVAVADETDRRELRETTERLRRIDAPLLGIVLNKVRKNASYGYYYGYSGENAPGEARLAPDSTSVAHR